MRCEQANPLLIEYTTQELPSEQMTAIDAHVDECSTCQADLSAIAAWQAMAKTWHEESPPNWQPQPLFTTGTGNFMEAFRTWFPTFASAAALVLVTVMFVNPPTLNGTLPTSGTTPADYDDLPRLPKATEAAVVQSVLDSSRDERGAEIQALLKVLKAEMDKRSIETEESLRYIITHQIQGQQEVDELYQRVEALMAGDAIADPAAPEGVLQ